MYDVTTTATFQDHLQAEELEHRYLPPEIIASAQTTWSWGQSNGESLFLLRRKNDPALLGHLSAFPVNPETANRLITGEVSDTSLCASAILPYGCDSPADLYIAILCVDQAHRPKGAYFLVSAFIDFLKKKYATGQCRFIGNIFAEAGTTDGQKVLERRGFQKCFRDQPVPCYYKAPLGSFLETRKAIR